jgi:predicted acyl esterase
MIINFLDAGLCQIWINTTERQQFWQQLKTILAMMISGRRGILQHLKDIKPAVMTVGGFFDAEDLYGPLNTYQAIEKAVKN